MPGILAGEMKDGLLAVIKTAKAVAAKEALELVSDVGGGLQEGAQEAKVALEKYHDHLEIYEEAVESGRLDQDGFERLLDRRKDELRLTVKAITNEELRSWIANLIDRSLGFLEAIGLGAAKAVGLPFG